MKKETKKLVSKPKDPGFTRMTEYSIEMTIPTGPFANIRPRITVVSQNPELAHAYCAPHMNKMWKEYFMVSERREEVAPTVTMPAEKTVTTATCPATEVCEAPPSSNVAVIKATQAIESCMSLEALDLIKNQVELSTKLLKEEKPALRDKMIMKFNELNADAFIKRNA